MCLCEHLDVTAMCVCTRVSLGVGAGQCALYVSLLCTAQGTVYVLQRDQAQQRRAGEATLEVGAC